MNKDVFNELRKIRNELKHGVGPRNPADLAKRLSDLGMAVTASDVPGLPETILRAFSGSAGLYQVPPLLPPVLEKLLEGREARAVLDPCAGLGAVLATVRNATGAQEALAFTISADEATLGKRLLGNAQWEIGDPIRLLNSLTTEVDVVASVLPFGAKHSSPISVATATGERVELQGDLGSLVLAATSARLAPEGVGLFVIGSSFFSSERSVLRRFDRLGLAIEAALALPFGAFAPYASIQTYLVVVRRRVGSRMFVAQLSNELRTNLQIIDNFKQGREGAALELGRYVLVQTFVGLSPIRLEERFAAAEREFGAPAIRLKEVATSITLGRFGDGFKFPEHDNAIYIPLIGNSDVVDSVEDRSLKPQNYAQVAIDPERSNARFVARFLNNEFGREIRELSKSGSTILKLNRRALEDLRVFVPDLQNQKAMLGVEARLTAEQNTVLGLQNEIAELRRRLWLSPRNVADVERRILTLSSRLSGNLRRQSAERLDLWSESLPFPLASIIRAWQATPSQDFRAQHEHLLHFFEATAAFVSVVLLSAFSSRDAVFDAHREKLAEALRGGNLSFERASFGTWKLVVEYLGKQARTLLIGGADGRALCADLFADPSLALPEVLCRKELAEVVARTNKMRNDWKGHGGVLGQEEAKLRNEQLLGELQRLREGVADIWADVQLIPALHCRPRRGRFETEGALLMGSTREVLKENRPMAMFLDVERLYLTHRDVGNALLLLPLVRVGPSPSSAMNACYFFNRLERDGARFVSYHFTDMPEMNEPFEDATETIKFLSST